MSGAPPVVVNHKLEDVDANRRLNLWALIAFALVIVNFVLIFVSWKPQWLAMGADEPVWVANAVKYWKTGSPIGHVPLFHDLIYPFVAGKFVNFDTGYTLWRFSIYLSCVGLMFYVLLRISNVWIAAILTLHFESLFTIYHSPTYLILALAFYLLALALVARTPKLLGVAVGMLLLGSLVRLEVLAFTGAALIMLAVFSRKAMFCRRFFKQLLVPALLFILLIYRHGSSIRTFPRDYVSRGQASAVWYAVEFLHSEGAFRKYTNAGRAAIPQDLIDLVLVEHFGKKQRDLVNSSALELWRRDPTLMEARLRDEFRRLPAMLAEMSAIAPRYGSANINVAWKTLGMSFLPCVLAVIWLRKRTRRTARGWIVNLFGFTPVEPNKSLVNPEFLALLLSGFAGFGPWLLTFPESYYMIVGVPVVYGGAALGMRFLTTRIGSAMTPSQKAAAAANP